MEVFSSQIPSNHLETVRNCQKCERCVVVFLNIQTMIFLGHEIYYLFICDHFNGDIYVKMYMPPEKR